MLDDAQVANLREQLAGFTVDAVHAVLGDAAWYALARNETVPARRATSDGSRLSTLIRLFQLQIPVPASAVRAGFGELAEPLAAAGVLLRDGDDVRAAVDIRPYGDEGHDWWVVADLTPGLDGRATAMDPSYVLGISEASSSLAQLTARPAVERALDLGTGCGVQALHLATHAQRVVATDVNPRALQMARLSARLNGVELDVRDGSLYEPVVGERFDLIATNPPFVVSPPDGARLVYRETAFPADDVVRRVVAGASDHLAPGGWCQILAAWVHREGEPWQERLASWIEPTGLDAWVVQREAADLASYAEMWLADAGLRGAPDYPERYDHWLSWFADQRIEAMGFGWISLRKAERTSPVVRIEEWTGDVGQPMGEAVLDWGRRVDALAGTDDVLERRWRLAPDARQVTYGPVGAADPATITVHLDRGPRRVAQVDTIEAGLLGTSDGELTAGQILDALASLLGRDREQLRATYAPIVRELVADGFLVP
ncbi:methyltransferase domain-containing protein [Aeromicrobium phragmitis]|uniref:Methyltransferase domain-containing protein n=1 Tax=Aeromicrobium phragmitis TaxID=2478914 RepID=A0A3L8PQI2_9ACTN|nr:methyltransferase domain-containing protein [Aeromicrobium phragmitis]